MRTLPCYTCILYIRIYQFTSASYPGDVHNNRTIIRRSIDPDIYVFMWDATVAPATLRRKLADPRHFFPVPSFARCVPYFPLPCRTFSITSAYTSFKQVIACATPPRTELNSTPNPPSMSPAANTFPPSPHHPSSARGTSRGARKLNVEQIPFVDRKRNSCWEMVTRRMSNDKR